MTGLGVARLSEAMAKNEIEMGALRVLSYDWTPDELVFFARFHGEKAPHRVRQAAQVAEELASEHS